MRFVRERPSRLDLELRVLGATEAHPATAFNRLRGDEPSAAVAYVHEEVVATLRVEVLDEAAPALVAAPSRDEDVPPVLSPAGRGLHLDPHQAAIELGDQIDVWAVPNGQIEVGALGRQPLHCRKLPSITPLDLPAPAALRVGACTDPRPRIATRGRRMSRLARHSARCPAVAPRRTGSQ